MSDNIPWAGLIPVAVLLVGFVAYCIVDIVRHDVKHLPKWAWIAISFLSIPLGGIIYLLVGRDANR
ncbi:MAG: hypothetical protein CVT68_01415 [Actinobacteria bacterium HGW-Actinobacteria-8]|nr:MAG: hypothetical protein CVT68_01415 [Actinobacteria bacterium HGW-Actinobacteria-8]